MGGMGGMGGMRRQTGPRQSPPLNVRTRWSPGGILGQVADAEAGGCGSYVRARVKQVDLQCSLEDLYAGTTKKMKITRQALNTDGKTTYPESKILTIDIKPGWKAGTKITFPKEGDQGPSIIPGTPRGALHQSIDRSQSAEGGGLSSPTARG